MKKLTQLFSVGDVLELVGLVLVVVAVYLAVGLWPALFACAVALGYLAHAWDWGPPEPSEPDVVMACRACRHLHSTVVDDGAVVSIGKCRQEGCLCQGSRR